MEIVEWSIIIKEKKSTWGKKEKYLTIADKDIRADIYRSLAAENFRWN